MHRKQCLVISIKEPTLQQRGDFRPVHMQLIRMLQEQYPFLEYHPPSIKSSMWGWLGNYLGFTGLLQSVYRRSAGKYHRAEVLSAFHSCHEIAHQLGYAKENEANFVGYLAAASFTRYCFSLFCLPRLFFTRTVTCSNRILQLASSFKKIDYPQ